MCILPSPHQAWKGTKFSHFLLEELKGEGGENSLPTAITHHDCRERSARLFPKNKNPFGTRKHRRPPGSRFWKSWGICLCISMYLFTGADNLVELRITCLHVYLLCSLGEVSDLPGHFQKFVRRSSVTVSRTKCKHMLSFAFIWPLWYFS